MVTNLSTSVTTLLFNLFMMKYAGADGVAAITAVLYCQFLMISFFLGFSMGTAPVVSYHYGADHRAFLSHILQKSYLFVVGTSVGIFLLGLGCAPLIAGLFFKTTSTVYPLAIHGLRLFSLSFLFAGVNIFTSGLFTALGNGRISAAISFSRTLLFTVLGIFIMSYFWQLDGLWLAIPVAEFCTIGVVLYFFRSLQTYYGIRLFVKGQ